MNQHDMTRNMVLAALFAALTAIGAFLQIPTGTVPITLQFLFTALAGLLLGWKWGAVSQLLYVGIGLLGLPVFTQGGGIGYVLQPSFGFLLGLIPAAAVIGALTARRTGYLNILAAVLVGPWYGFASALLCGVMRMPGIGISFSAFKASISALSDGRGNSNALSGSRRIRPWPKRSKFVKATMSFTW